MISNVPQGKIDRFRRIKYGKDFRRLTRQIKRPVAGFCAKDRLDSTVKIDPDHLVKSFESHCFQLPAFRERTFLQMTQIYPFPFQESF